MLIVNHHHLYYFWVAAREGSIVKACEKLHLAQPTVSAQIIKLEKELGKTLFERQRRGMKLTEDGRLVLGYAEQIFNYSQEMVDTLKDIAGSRQLRVQIGIVDQVSKEIAQSLLSSVFKETPQAMTTVFEGRLPPLLADLKTHAIDVLLSNVDMPVEEAADYLKAEIGNLAVDFIAAPALARQIKRFPADLGEVPLLLPTRASPIWSQVEHYLNHHQVNPRILAEIQDAELLQRMTVHGFGAAPLDRASVRAGIKEGSLRQINPKPTGITETYWLITKKRQHTNPVAQELMNHFRIS